MNKHKIIFIIGVSGCGKSTIGKLLSQSLCIPFFDGDDYHSKENINKMASGQALNDTDRKEWLKTLNTLATLNSKTGAIIVCSGLKQVYRNLLKKNIEEASTFIFLKGSIETILKRLQSRKNHFMPSNLLQSQFDILEPPKDALHISINNTPAEIINQIKTKLTKNTTD